MDLSGAVKNRWRIMRPVDLAKEGQGKTNKKQDKTTTPKDS